MNKFINIAQTININDIFISTFIFMLIFAIGRHVLVRVEVKRLASNPIRKKNGIRHSVSGVPGSFKSPPTQAPTYQILLEILC